MRELNEEESALVCGGYGHLDPPQGEVLARELRSLQDSVWMPAIHTDPMPDWRS